MDIRNAVENSESFDFSFDSPVLASEPCARVSDDYKFMSTIEVVNRLQDDGWRTMSVQHTNKRNKAKIAHIECSAIHVGPVPYDLLEWHDRHPVHAGEHAADS